MPTMRLLGGVEPGDHESRRVDQALAGRRQVAEQTGHRDRTGADAQDVGVGRAGDLAGNPDRLLAGGDVGVEVPVPLRGGRVPPAHGEVLHPGGHRVLHQAAARSDVGDVVLVDLRRDRDQRPAVDRRRGRRVLDELEHLAPVDDLAGGDGQVPAHPEGSGVDGGGHPRVVAHVVREVAEARRQAHAPGLDGLGQRRRVAGQAVRRGRRLGEQREPRTGLARGSWGPARPRRRVRARPASGPGSTATAAGTAGWWTMPGP